MGSNGITIGKMVIFFPMKHGDFMELMADDHDS